MRRIQSGQSGEMMVNRLGRTVRQRAVTSISPIGPTASPRASCRIAKPPAAGGRRAQHRGHLVGMAHRKNYLHDLIASDRRYPTVNAYGPLFGSPEYSTDIMPILDPEDAYGDDLQHAGARSGHAGGARARPCGEPSSRRRRRPIGAMRRSGTHRPTITTPCSTRRAGCGWRRRSAAWTTRPSASRAPIIPPRRCSRSSGQRVR